MRSTYLGSRGAQSRILATLVRYEERSALLNRGSPINNSTNIHPIDQISANRINICNKYEVLHTPAAFQSRVSMETPNSEVNTSGAV